MKKIRARGTLFVNLLCEKSEHLEGNIPKRENFNLFSPLDVLNSMISMTIFLVTL